MRRYVTIAVAIIVVAIFAGFTFFPDEETVITKLLNERVFILQNAYYGRISEDVAKTLLLEIESTPLLTEDENELAQNTDGEMDIINNLYLINAKRINKGKDETSYEVEILWDMQGITENYYQKCTYLISITKKDRKAKLAKMTAIAS